MIGNFVTLYSADWKQMFPFIEKTMDRYCVIENTARGGGGVRWCNG